MPFLVVMAGLDPAIHIDPRDKPGGDEEKSFVAILMGAALVAGRAAQHRARARRHSAARSRRDDQDRAADHERVAGDRGANL